MSNDKNQLSFEFLKNNWFFVAGLVSACFFLASIKFDVAQIRTDLNMYSADTRARIVVIEDDIKEIQTDLRDAEYNLLRCQEALEVESQ